MAKKIDDEVRAIIERGYDRATEVLTTHKDRLTELAEALVAKETIEAEEFEAMFADLPDPRKDAGGRRRRSWPRRCVGLGKPRPRAAGHRPARRPEPTPQPA